MFQNNIKLRIFVRNKARYNPASKEYGFLHVDVANYAGTTIGDIKENVKKQCKNSLKLDDLFLNNEKLSDERSVAHYNLQDGMILESTSNPFWVTCLHIKQYEVEQTKADNPNDKAIQGWTTKSINRKRTLLSVLMNSKNEFPSQPPHFPTLEDFVVFLERLNKKGARMNPLYTQRDLQEMHDDYVSNYVGQSGDPLGAYILDHSVRLGLKQAGHQNQIQNADGNNNGRGRRNQNNIPPRQRVNGPQRQANNNGQPRAPRNNGGARARKDRTCEDCEVQPGDVYCPECQNSEGGQGLVLCQNCSTTIHRGAARRGHQLQDVAVAPKVTKPYVPHAFKAPFALLLALYSGMTGNQRILSMTEDEIKNRAQPLTDTDLSDKQNGRYVGGFECMENCLIAKHLVQKEDSANPTYALTETGYQLAIKLFGYQQSVQRFLRSHDFPVVPTNLSTMCGTRKLCLIVDEQERDRERFLQLADQWGIDVQVRGLPAGDYIWILSPPVQGPHVQYQQRQPTLEKVLPFIVERKSWEDLDDSIRTKRFHKQILRMLDSGIPYCFYLMEGSISSLKYKTEQQLQKLKDELENIFHRNGFYINFTASWFKTAIWLRWFTELIALAVQQGMFKHECQTYADFCRKANVQPRTTIIPQTDHRKVRSTVWSADQFVDNIFRESRHLQTVVTSVNEELSAPRNKQVLMIQGLEAYNKKRQTLQNKCLVETCDTPERTEDLVEDKFTTNSFNMVHYDIMCYRQLQIQIFAHVYVLRTESQNDTNKRREQFNNYNDNVPRTAEGNSTTGNQTYDVDTEEFMVHQALARSSRTKRQKTPQKGPGSSKSPPNRKKTPKKTKDSDTVKGSRINDKTGSGDSQDEDLQRALELSRQCALEFEQGKNGQENGKGELYVPIVDPLDLPMMTDSQEELQQVLELSKQSVAMGNIVQTEREIGSRISVGAGSSDSQDEALQEVLKLSLLEQDQPKQTLNNNIIDENCNTSAIGLTNKHTLANSNAHIKKSDRNFSNSPLISEGFGENLTDSQELEKVLNLSKMEHEQNLSKTVNVTKVLNPSEKASDLKKDLKHDNSIRTNLDLDGAEELRFAMTQELSSTHESRRLNELSEEEQIRLAIEQSKKEVSKNRNKSNTPPSSEKLKIDYCSKNSYEEVILIDSQNTDSENSQENYIEIDDSQSQGLEADCDFVDTSSHNGTKSGSKIKTAQYECLKNNLVDTDKLDQDFQGLAGLSREETLVLVQDTQVENFDDEQNGEKDFVPETVDNLGLDGVDEEIDVIPPSPEKESPMQHRRLSCIMEKNITKLNSLGSENSTQDLDCNRPSPGNEIETKSVNSFIKCGDETVLKETEIKDYSASLVRCKEDAAVNKTEMKDYDNVEGSQSSHSVSLFDFDDNVEGSRNQNLDEEKKVKDENVDELSQASQGSSLLSCLVDVALAEVEENVGVKVQEVKVDQVKKAGRPGLVKVKVKVEPENNTHIYKDEMKVKIEPGLVDGQCLQERMKSDYEFKMVKQENIEETEAASLSDAEYAKRLQAELDMEMENEEAMKIETKRRQTRSKVSEVAIATGTSINKEQDQVVDTSKDAEIARQLQESLNKGDNHIVDDKKEKRKPKKRTHDEISSQQEEDGLFVSLTEVISQHEAEEEIQAKLKREQEDFEMARQLNENGGDHIKNGKENIDVLKHDREQADREIAMKFQDGEMPVNLDVYDEEEKRSKLEREKADRELALKLQEVGDGDVISPLLQRDDINLNHMLEADNNDIEQGTAFLQRNQPNTQDTVERIWSKQLNKAMQKSKASLKDQLQQVRQSQNAKYRGMASPNGSRNLHSAGNISSTHSSNPYGTPRSNHGPSPTSTFSPYRTPSTHASSSTTTSSPYGTHSSTSPGHLSGRISTGTTIRTSRTDSSASYNRPSTSSDRPSLYHPPEPVYIHDEDSLPEINDINDVKRSQPSSQENQKHFSDFESFSATSCKGDSVGPSSSQPTVSSSNSWSTDMSSSQISGNMANVTCGNCKQKGHNRKWNQCPNYHSFEETQRRQKQEDDKRRRIEEEVNRQQQTKDELERHKTQLEEIAAQIQAQQQGLVQTIKKLDKKTKKKK